MREGKDKTPTVQLQGEIDDDNRRKNLLISWTRLVFPRRKTAGESVVNKNDAFYSFGFGCLNFPGSKLFSSRLEEDWVLLAKPYLWPCYCASVFSSYARLEGNCASYQSKGVLRLV